MKTTSSSCASETASPARHLLLAEVGDLWRGDCDTKLVAVCCFEGQRAGRKSVSVQLSRLAVVGRSVGERERYRERTRERDGEREIERDGERQWERVGEREKEREKERERGERRREIKERETDRETE